MIVLRGLAVGVVGEKKKRNAVGPSDGKTNGVRVNMATPARIAMVRKPLMNMNAAQTGRSGKRSRRRDNCSRSTSPRVTRGSRTSSGWREGRGRSGSAIRSTVSHATIEIEGVQEKASIHEEDDNRCESGRNQHVRVTAQQSVDRRREKPELDHDQRADQETNRREER
jgi:hypothetical protein